MTSTRVRAGRAAFRLAWLMRKGVRLLPFPHLNGAMVAVWVDGHVLMIQNTYNSYWSLPGGRLDAGENYRDAAARELREETAVVVAARDLAFAHGEYMGHALRRDRVELFEASMTARPEVSIDPIEIAQAAWLTAEEAFRLPLFGPTRRYLQDRTGQGDS